METEPLAVTIESNEDDDGAARRAIVSLATNLNSTGAVRAKEVKRQSTSNESIENKDIGVVLCALSLAIVKGVAIKVAVDAIVNAVKATFSAHDEKKMKMTLVVKGKEISITAKHVTGQEREKLIRMLEAEL